MKKWNSYSFLSEEKEINKSFTIPEPAVYYTRKAKKTTDY